MGDGMDDLFVYSPHAGMADAYRNMDYHFYNYSEVLQYYVPFEVRLRNIIIEIISLFQFHVLTYSVLGPRNQIDRS